jgi:hypothetical protein
MKLPFSYPKKSKSEYEMTIQAYDRDFFKSNDIIGEARISLEIPFEDVALTKRPITLNKSYYKSYLKQNSNLELDFKDETTFFVEILSSEVDKKGRPKSNGKIRI